MKSGHIYTIKRADFYLQTYKKADQWVGSQWCSDIRYAKRYTSKGQAERIAKLQNAQVYQIQ